MYMATTHDILVNVLPVYIDERSNPSESLYYWAYRITISNLSKVQVQLISRYWHISDANGHVEEVRGEGVVGEQPVLKEGEEFTYTSGCPLKTPSGIMSGHYIMHTANGDTLEVEIPAFPLDLPDLHPSLN